MNDEKKRRDLIERYGPAKGNRIADEIEGKTPDKPKRAKKKDKEDE